MFHKTPIYRYQIEVQEAYPKSAEWVHVTCWETEERAMKFVSFAEEAHPENRYRILDLRPWMREPEDAFLIQTKIEGYEYGTFTYKGDESVTFTYEGCDSFTINTDFGNVYLEGAAAEQAMFHIANKESFTIRMLYPNDESA